MPRFGVDKVFRSGYSVGVNVDAADEREAFYKAKPIIEKEQQSPIGARLQEAFADGPEFKWKIRRIKKRGN